MTRRLTDHQRKALRWLFDHSGDGMFDRNGVLLAAGETAPVMRMTWNTLRDLGLVETYNQIGRGRGRLRLTQVGRAEAERTECTP